MTSHARAWLGTLLFVAASLASTCASAQRGTHADPDCAADDAATHAECVAGWVQAFYDRTTSLEADFQQDYWTRVYDRTASSRGQLRIVQPGRIRFDYSAPNHKIIVGSGDRFTYYDPSDDGTAGQYYHATTDAASRALGFLTGTARLDEDFNFRIVTTPTQPAHTVCLELRPRAPDPHMTRVRLYVSTADTTRGVVVRVGIEDPDGNWNTFRFTNFHFNREIAASTFEYTPPEGAREITPPASH